MAVSLSSVKSYLDQKGIKYQDSGRGFIVITYSADNLSEVSVIVDVASDRNKATFVCFSIGQFEEEQFAQALIACNACNSRFRWVKFYLDDENRVTVSSDAILDEDTCGEECLEIVRRIVAVVDEAYPVFMKARWA